VVLVERAPARTSRDYLPFAVLAVVLGGMPSSRLDVELRESDVGSGGVDVSYDTRLAGGELVVAVDVGRRGSDIAAAIDALLETLTRMVDEGPGNDELAVAKTLVRERLRSSLEESDDAAAMIGEAFALGVGVDELGRLDDEIARITPRDIRDVAGRWLRPDRAPIVVTGELNSISFAFNVADIGSAVVRP
jgi:predicted Zn-dependent peptidase